MRPFLTLLWALCVGSSLFAQQTEAPEPAAQLGHYNLAEGLNMKFLDVDLNHTVGSLVEALEERGFVLTEANESRMATMRGTIEGHDCLLHIYGSHRSRLVYLVCVEFDHTHSWSELNALFERFSCGIETLIPQEEREASTARHRIFGDGFQEGNGRELEGLASGEVVVGNFYVDPFTFGMGHLLLKMNASASGEGWLSIEIVDFANSLLHDEELIQTL